MGELNETIETYDKDVERYLNKLEFPMPIEDLDGFAVLLKGKRILDAGCGAGRDAVYFAEKGFNVIGIDLSKEMLEAAKKRANADFRVGDVRKTGFDDDSFDGVWCYNTLLHLDKEDVHAALKEFARILKSEGILFIATKQGKGKIAKEGDKGIKHFYHYEKEDFLDLFREIGFELIKSKSYPRKNDEVFIDLILRKCN